MDQAFVPLARLLEALWVVDPEYRDDEAGVHSYVTGCEVESPIELDVSREGGALHIGSVPPLYPLQTSVAPVMHRVRIVVAGERRAEP